MTGFHSTPLQYAEGGVVSRMLKAVGVGRAPADQPAQQTQAPAPTPAPAPAPAPEKAVTGYAGMSAMQRRERAAGLYANGGAVQPRKGMVQGPGTGTSDDVPDQVQEGTYIMPADSTKAIGPKALGGMGGGFEQWAKGQGEQGQIPVQLSNGEYKMPPEQVHAVGVQALDGLKNATHTPAPERSPFKFANGGFAGFAQNQRRLHLNGGSVATQKRLEEEGRTPNSPMQMPQTPPGRIPTNLNRPITPPNATPKTTSFGDYAAQQSGAVAQATTTPAAPPAAPKQDTNIFGRTGPATSPIKMPDAPAGRVPLNMSQPVATQPKPRTTSFGDYAAQQSGAVEQGAPMTEAQRQSALNSIPGQDRSAPTAFAPAQQPPAPLGAQAQADRAKLGAAWDTAKGVADDAGRAVADVATMIPRGLVGAYDSTVVRGMRAAGLGADYLSPHLVPNGVDPASMTPFTDQKRMQAAAPAPAQAQATVERPGQGRVLPGLEQYETQPGQTAGAGAADNALPDGVTQTSVPGAQAEHARQAEAARVYRKGNTFSDSPEGTSYGATANAAPRPESGYGVSTVPGQPVASAGQSRFEQLAQQIANQRTPEVAHSGNDWGIRNNLRNMAVSANSIMNRPQFDRRGRQIGGASPAQAAYESALKVDAAAQDAQADVTKQGMRGQTDLLREALQQAGGMERESLQQQGADRRDAQRNAMEGKRMSFEQYAKGVELKGAERQERLFKRYEAAKTPEEKSQIAQQIRDLSGKSQADWAVQVTPPTKNVDGSTTAGSIVRYNKATGEVMPVQQGGGQALPPGMVKQVGTSNGQPVYEDANGKRHITG